MAAAFFAESKANTRVKLKRIDLFMGIFLRGGDGFA
jgi:hypothetical protein